jgi:hypothetical protein
MVPLITPPCPTARAALQARIIKSCRRDLSKAFAAWVLRAPEGRAEFVALASGADKRMGASQDFHTVGILGFAADAGLVFERQIQRLKQGLRRLAGRSAMVNGVPMPFSTDAVGILGVALGTAVAADLELAGAVAVWAARFLKASYERDRADDWQRCLFAAADRKIGSLLKLSIPNSIASADVRIALLARGLIDYDDTQVRQDTAPVLDLVTQELPDASTPNKPPFASRLSNGQCAREHSKKIERMAPKRQAPCYRTHQTAVLPLAGNGADRR